MIRVVIDTNVVVSAVLQRLGYSAAVIELVLQDQIIPCVSPAILEEYREVLSRPRIRVDPARAHLIQHLLAESSLVIDPIEPLTICSDPDDNMFLECAEALGADFLITGNVAHFPRQHKTTYIVKPRMFIEAWRKL